MAPQSVVKVEMVHISLSPQEQKLFEDFKRQQSNLGIILRSGALDIRSGSFTAHVDSAGLIQRIDRQDSLYVK